MPAAIAVAFAYVCLAWACAALIAFLLAIAVSIEDVPILLRRAVQVSAPAMWFVPAALFLSSWSLFRVIVGVLLVANTVRLLVARMAPRASGDQKRYRRSTRLFRDSNLRTGVLSSGSMPALVGAFALQVAFVSVLGQFAFLAAVMAAICAAAWTISSIKGRAYEPGKAPGARRTVAAVLLTLLLSAGLSVPTLYLRAAAIGAKTSAASADRESPLNTGASVKVSPDVPKILLSGNKFVPGVILMPPAKSHRQPRIRLGSAHLGFAGNQSLAFPFTGEYQLFPTLSGSLQPGSVVYPGTPLDAIYVTLGGTPLETHGYQKLNPPIDFSNCARVQMTIISGERSPASALIQLIHATGVLNLGSDFFGLEPGPEETLSFPVPQTGARLLVNAMRIAFYRDPSHREQSTRVAIEQFTLVPRGL
jgi:hypothetical protein